MRQKNIFEAAGGFDASYRNASGEDNNLSYKILELGSKIYFEPKSSVDHFFPTSIKNICLNNFDMDFGALRFISIIL